MHRTAFVLSLVLACTALHASQAIGASPGVELAQAGAPKGAPPQATQPAPPPAPPQAQPAPPPAPPQAAAPKKAPAAKAATAERVSLSQLLSEGYYVGGLSVSPTAPGNAYLVLQRDDTVYMCSGFVDLNQMNYPRSQFDKCAPLR